MKAMVRSTLSICLVVVLLFSCMCLNGLALDLIPIFNCGDYVYETHYAGDYAIIRGYEKQGNTLTIPGFLDGKPVGAFDFHFFRNHKFSSFVVESNNLFFKVVDGVLYDRSGENLIRVPNNYKGKLVIPKGVTTINANALYQCNKLTEVIFPQGLTTIESYAFAECGSIKKISFPRSLKYIGDNAFEDCTQLETITIPDETQISFDVFDNTRYMNQEKNWKNGVLYIGNHLVSAQKLTATSYTVKQGTISIVSRAFKDITTLTKVVIPDSVKRIGNWAFDGCSNLTTVVTPKTGCDVKIGAFDGVPSAPDESVPRRNDLTYYGTILMKVETESKPKESVFYIPSDTTVVAEGAFDMDFPYEEIWIPNSLTTFEPFVFSNYNSELTAYKIQQDNPYFTVIDGVLYNKEVTTLIHCPPKKDSIVIPQSVTKIAPAAFSFCKKLTEIVLPNGLLTIGKEAFSYCENLKKLSIPQSVGNLDLGSVINNCTRLETVSIPKNVTRLTGTYSYPHSLQIEQIPYGVKYIAPEYLRDKVHLRVYSNSFALEFAKQYGVKYKITKQGPKPVTSKVEKPIASSPASSVVSKPQETVSSVVETLKPQEQEAGYEQPIGVETPTEPLQTPTNAPQQPQSANLWIWIACGGAVILGVVAFWLWRKRK